MITFPSLLHDKQSEEERPAELRAVKHNSNLNSHAYLPKAAITLKIGTTFEFDLQFDRAFKMDSDSLKIVFKTGMSFRMFKRICYDSVYNFLDKLFIGEHMEVNVDLEDNKLAGSWNGQITSVKDDTLSLKVEIPEEIPLGRWSLVVTTKLLNSENAAESAVILTGIYIC